MARSKLGLVVGALGAVVQLVSSTACGPTKRTDGGRGLLAPQSPAPSFAAPDQLGKTRTLEEFRGMPVVLYFYPKDSTPGCTKEACAFRDAWTELQRAGAQVLGVSRDDVASHRRFAEEHKLPFPLLADTEGKILAAYGVGTTVGFPHRVTFLIDRVGKVAKVYPDVDPAIHVRDVLADLTALPAAP